MVFGPQQRATQYVLAKPRDMHRMGVSPGMPHLCYEQTACIREHLARHQALFLRDLSVYSWWGQAQDLAMRPG